MNGAMQLIRSILVIALIGTAFTLPACAQQAATTEKEVGVVGENPDKTPCTDPMIMAARQLMDDKLFDRANSLAARLLNNPKTSVCAAELLKTIADEKKSEDRDLLTTTKDKLPKLDELPLILAGLVLSLIAIVILWRLSSSIRRRYCQDVSWRVRSIATGSDATILAAWRSGLSDQRQTNADGLALLVQAGVTVPRVSIAIAAQDADQIDVFTDAPEVLGVKLSWFRSVIQSIRRFAMSPRRTIAVWAISRERSAMMRVEARDAKGQIRFAAMSTAWTSDADAAQEIDKMAAAMALRTSYLVADWPDSKNSKSRLRLHEGIERLTAYASGNDGQALTRAAEAFAEARRNDPSYFESYLYEGIARELLEEHDAADTLFEEVIANAPRSAAAAHAKFNLAVSHLRRYTPTDLERAVAEFEAISADPQAPDGLAAFAVAAKANAVAHRFIFWDAIGPTNTGEFASWPADLKARKKDQLEDWSTEVVQLLGRAEASLANEPFRKDGQAATQLRWLIENAKGNHALNRAGRVAEAYGHDVDARKKILEDALQSFKKCEILLPAGVETLTNLATTLLRLDRPSESIAYSRRARALNPAYEYAFMREAQAEIVRGNDFAAVEVMKAARSSLPLIRISEFQKLFRQHRVAFDGR